MAESRKLTERAREMRRLLAAQERSGLSLAEFARRQGLRPNTLAWWRHRLKHGDEKRRNSGAAQFIEITPAPGGRGVPMAAFEVVLGDGTVIRVPEHFGTESLARLLAVLRC